LESATREWPDSGISSAWVTSCRMQGKCENWILEIRPPSSTIPRIMAPPSVDAPDLLKQVSRSFYLTLAVLPRSMKRPVGLAYLLARAADAISDTTIVGIPRRHQALLELRGCIDEACQGRPTTLPELGDLAEARETTVGEGTPAERKLLKSINELLDDLQKMDREDRLRIGKLLDTITHGQETDLLLFTGSPGEVSAFGSDEDLDRYTYEVAGCVGEFWTEMCRAHVFRTAPLDYTSLLADAVRFGKGLQLVNILRDLPKDLRRGRCYIPSDQLTRLTLRPEDLLDPAVMNRFRVLYEDYLRRAEAYLKDGWRYTAALPFRCVRIRLACAWPLLIGVRTLGLLRLENVLDERSRIKISRPEMQRLMLRSVVLYPFRSAWDRLFTAVQMQDTGSRMQHARTKDHS